MSKLLAAGLRASHKRAVKAIESNTTVRSRTGEFWKLAGGGVPG